MSIESLLQQNMQNAGLAGIDRLAGNAMYPQSHMDKTQYAVPSQMPTSAEVIQSDYDTPTKPYTGMQPQMMAQGGVARFDGEYGSMVESPVESPVEPTAPPTMAELSAQLNEAYRTNSNYDDIWKQFAATREQDPKEWYRHQLGFLGGQEGWQIGQNTSERNAAIQPQVEDTIAQARAAGLSDQEIQQILEESNQVANYTNQRRIAQEAANSGNGFSQMIVPAATIGAMVAAPYLAPMLAPTLGTFGGAMAAGALTGGALGGLGAGVSGGNVGQGILRGGATGAIGSGVTAGLSGLDPSVAQGLKGLNTAKNVYSALDSGGKNVGATINAFRGVSSMAPVSAAHGGLMYDRGGEINNPMGEAIPENTGSLYDAYRSLIPAQVRTFAETLGGERSPITEKNFTKKELEQIKEAIDASRERQKGRSWIQEKIGEPLKQYYNPTVGYDDYGQSKGRFDDLSVSQNSAIRNTLGRFAYHKDPEGNLVATDSYDFYNDLPKKTRPTSDYENMGTLQKIGTLAADTLTKRGGISTLPSRVGNAFIGKDGRPVMLNLGPANFAGGGITTLGSYSDGGRLLKGPGDGMSDDIPAKIGNAQPARLADGEFVIPADVVSHLGNGSTDAGAKQLYKMMDKIRHARTGNKKQGKRINPDKYLP